MGSSDAVGPRSGPATRASSGDGGAKAALTGSRRGPVASRFGLDGSSEDGRRARVLHSSGSPLVEANGSPSAFYSAQLEPPRWLYLDLHDAIKPFPQSSGRNPATEDHEGRRASAANRQLLGFQTSLSFVFCDVHNRCNGRHAGTLRQLHDAHPRRRPTLS